MHINYNTCICLACMDDKINVYIFQLAPWTKWNSVPVYAFTKLFLNLILTVNKTKNFWLLSPTQLLTQGQWWSIFLIHLWQTLKRITKMSKIYKLVFMHLYLLEILSYCPAYKQFFLLQNSFGMVWNCWWFLKSQKDKTIVYKAFCWKNFIYAK